MSLVPEEEISLNEIRRISVPIYGMTTWGDMFASRQVLALITLTRLVHDLCNTLTHEYDGFSIAIQTCLALAVDRQADYTSSLARWHTTRELIAATFGRQAIGMVWDFAEVNPNSEATGGFSGALEWVSKVCEENTVLGGCEGNVELATVTAHPFPDQAAQALITDPPYYDAVPYAHLSDFFYVWLRRSIAHIHSDFFKTLQVPKEEEIVVDRPHRLSNSRKDIAFYHREMAKALADNLRLLRPDGIGTIIFASKTTVSWEALLQAVVNVGWTVTGSWPIDTEMVTRVAAQDQARLASSVHLVCRPRKDNTIGDWRDVLQELPERIEAWLPRLAQEGIIGADAIFACIGPALEIFSRYAFVEKASGDKVKLKEYLEHIWAAVAREALNAIFQGADTTGFEEDARLTAIWFWTLKAAANGNGKDAYLSAEDEEDIEDSEEEAQPGDKKKKISGYVLEYDAARKLAQGLGADLAKLSRPGGIITIKGNIAALNGIAHRENHLIGRQLSLFGEEVFVHPGQIKGAKSPGPAQMKFVESRGDHLRGEEIIVPSNPVQPLLPSFQPTEHLRSLMDRLLDNGITVLDRLHQAMLLFGGSQTALLGPFLQATHMGSDLRFWRLANALSALYPPQSEEKRWVDGVLGRKKALGY